MSKKLKLFYKTVPVSLVLVHLGNKLCDYVRVTSINVFCFASSDIYSTPRLTEPLENASSFAGSGGIIGLSSGSINANTVSQRHRIESLKTTSASSSSVTQPIDSGSCDSRHRQGKYFFSL